MPRLLVVLILMDGVTFLISVKVSKITFKKLSVCNVNALFSSISSLVDLVWCFLFMVLVELKYLVVFPCLCSSLRL